MQKYQDAVQRTNGQAVVGASVAVQSYPAGVAATIYSDNSGTVATNPLTTDSLGNFSFYAPNGRYQLVISGTGITTRTQTDVELYDEVSVKDYGATGDGVTDDTAALAAALAAVSAMSPKPKLIFPPGIYKYTVSPNWAVQDLWVEAQGMVFLYYTGTGNAVILDAGASAFIYNVRFTGNFYVQGGASSLNGIYLRSVHHSFIEARVTGCGSTYAALRVEFAVCTEFRIVSSVNEAGFSAQPANGIYLTQRGASEQCSACTFYNPVIEGVSGAGITLDYAIKNKFIGGTSEGNTGLGLTLTANASLNAFYGLDLEANTGGDIQDAGNYNEFHSLLSDSTVTITAAAVMSQWYGGTFNNVVDSGKGTVLDSISYATNGGAITGTANQRVKRSVYNVTGAAFDVDQSSNGLVSTSAGIGYGTGSGGAVTQATNKSTGVTLNKTNGVITMNAASLGATTSVAFTLTNSLIAATDTVVPSIASGATTNSYTLTIESVAAGSCRFSLRNYTGGALAEALVINFAVIKGVSA